MSSAVLHRPGLLSGVYPQREDFRPSWLDRLTAGAIGRLHQHALGEDSLTIQLFLARLRIDCQTGQQRFRDVTVHRGPNVMLEVGPAPIAEGTMWLGERFEPGLEREHALEDELWGA